MTGESNQVWLAIFVMIFAVAAMGILMVWEFTGYWPWEV